LKFSTVLSDLGEKKVISTIQFNNAYFFAKHFARIAICFFKTFEKMGSWPGSAQLGKTCSMFAGLAVH
jgi:hypothetical protein